MSRPRRLSFDLDDLSLAYRKAKVDLHYSNDPRPIELLAYELELQANLESLMARLNGQDASWVTHSDFLGDYTVIPKGLERDESQPSTVYVSSAEAWAQSSRISRTASFRLISRCSIDMHVLGALWIGRVGAVMDAALSDSARGYRLRRTSSGDYNWYSSGSFEPYLAPYRRWQDDGFRAMEAALQDGSRVTTVIGDASSFFHNIDPSFLSHPMFLDRVGAKLSRADQRLHRFFVRAIVAWQAHMSELTGVAIAGLPLSYPASAVVANLAMVDFDHTINARIRPRYYGRYVDDIILVLESGESLSDSDSTWQWLSDQFAPAPNVDLTALNGSHVYSADYLGGSRIAFDNDKNRVFLMEGEAGLSLIKAIRATISERSSEWRAMPQLAEKPEDVGPEVVRALTPDGTTADSLRTAQRMTTSRALFALTVRDFEAFARDLDAGSWSAQRKAFYVAVRHHILVPQVALDMDAYIVRILRVAIHCEDWDELVQLVMAIATVYRSIAAVPVIALKSAPDGSDLRDLVTNAWGARIRRSVTEALVATAVHGVRIKVIEAIELALKGIPGDKSALSLRPKAIKTKYQQLFVHDLAYEPYRVQLLPEEIRPASLGRPSSQAAAAPNVPVPSKLARPLVQLARALEKVMSQPAGLESHPALVYPTRPLAALEIFAITRVLSPLVSEEAEDFGPWLFAMRGFEVDAETSSAVVQTEGGRQLIRLTQATNLAEMGGRTRIAVTMLEIGRHSWMSSLHGRPDHSGARYRRVAELIDAVLSSSVRPDYVLLPELALPASWFIGVARKLASRGISLISGVEYLHAPHGVVRNQVWASLMTDVMGFKASVIYRQDKQRPAPHERESLATVPPTPLTLEAAIPWDLPPLIWHGDNLLALLVCSELTNIDYRASLRGKIDVLFVPEWNRDLHTFESLVEAGALDMHAYVAQANNRAFGDSRVRAPRSESHARDLVRVRGGLNDYFVVAELDIDGLRSFQSQTSALNGPFKPLPDGFKIDERRRVVPNVRGSD